MPKVIQERKQRTRYFPIQTYSSLKKYILNLDKKQNELHIFGTTGITRKVQKLTGITSLSLSGAQQLLFDSFQTVKSSIYLQSLLREEIINKSYRHKKYLLNHLSAIVDTYYIFAELGKVHLNTRYQDSQQNEVMQLINFLLKQPITKQYFANKTSLDKREISKRLVRHPNLDNIFFYEIEYMNFGRMSFIYWLQKKGFNIEFRVPYHKQLKEVHRFWNSVYSVVTNVNLDELKHKQDDIKRGNKFGYFYENEQYLENDSINLKLIEFETPYDFTRYYKLYPEKLLAIDPKAVSHLVDHYKDPIYENDIGKFIYFLQFCRLENGKIFVRYDSFIELMTSSFVETNVAKGKDALSYLLDLEEYMSGTETIDEIKDRLLLLTEFEQLSRSFDRENAEDVGRNRMKRYMLNPFRAFAFLNQDRYEVTIHQLIELVEKLEQTLKYFLIEENETANVNEYFSRWISYLEQHINGEGISFWIEVFNTRYPEDWNFAIEELLQLIYLEVSSVSDEKKTIRSMDSVLEVMLEESTPSLHITNITQMNFPEKYRTSISEFFDYTEIKECIQENIEERAEYLYFLLVDFTVAHSFEQLSIYQLYQILSQFTGDITLSLIKNLDKHSFRNIHFDILADLYCNGEIIAYEAPSNEWQPEKENSTLSKPFSVEKIAGKIPDLYWLDHDFCSKKFFLTTFIEQQPVYHHEFHQRFIFSKIGKLFSYSKDEREQFRKYIYPLFPNWTYTLKENLIDLEYKTELRHYKTFENISYPKEMKSLQILRTVYRENRRTKARNQYRRDKFNDKELIKQFEKNIDTKHVVAEPGNHCKMCPHLDSCVEGMYAIDNLN